MSAILMENSSNVRVSRVPAEHGNVARLPLPNQIVDLGIWLSGVESFLSGGAPADLSMPSTSIAMINAALRRSALLATYAITLHDLPRHLTFDIRRLLPPLRQCMLVGEALSASETSEWHAWCRMLRVRLISLPEFRNVIRTADREAERYLPRQLATLLEHGTPSSDRAELAVLLPRFAGILRVLKVVGEMLAKDEPLKPSLLLFSRVYGQIADLTGYLSNRLERFADHEADLFASLDAASYTVSVELKKVYSQELAGLSTVRPAPSIYARVETAHALLVNSFQQIVSSLARVADPKMDIYDLFPDLRAKRDRSVMLLDDLAELIKIVRQSEVEPEASRIDKLNRDLTAFRRGSAEGLFFKDFETVERFIEEIAITTQEKDLVPMLHRFGAYLETLSGQVSLRSVLAD